MNILFFNRDRAAVINTLTAILKEYVARFDFEQFQGFYSAKGACYRTTDSAMLVAMSLIPGIIEQLENSTEQYPNVSVSTAHLEFSVMVQNNDGQTQLRIEIEWVAHACGVRWVDI